MARTPFCSQVLFLVAFFFVSSRAKPRDPGSFSTPADAPPTTDQPRCVKLELRSGTLCHSARSEESRLLELPRPTRREAAARPRAAAGRQNFPRFQVYGAM